MESDQMILTIRLTYANLVLEILRLHDVLAIFINNIVIWLIG